MPAMTLEASRGLKRVERNRAQIRTKAQERGQCDTGDQASTAGVDTLPLVRCPSTFERMEHDGHPQ
jgi:hypothetical protein